MGGRSVGTHMAIARRTWWLATAGRLAGRRVASGRVASGRATSRFGRRTRTNQKLFEILTPSVRNTRRITNVLDVQIVDVVQAIAIHDSKQSRSRWGEQSRRRRATAVRCTSFKLLYGMKQPMGRRSVAETAGKTRDTGGFVTPPAA